MPDIDIKQICLFPHPISGYQAKSHVNHMLSKKGKQMPDDKTKRHPQDGQRVDINDPKEVSNWCNSLGVDEITLANAVHAAGTYIDDVKKYLGK
ncbi:MAG: DUF3606 domain-containing protein [Kiritimatiellae bacterium]|nr:DUF3606 domain-containing protein [Kiritimatiellia bacterium]